jgi:DNA-binding XRE family transcriptional regulator/quercetin dioxygenase-like cupin family protein
MDDKELGYRIRQMRKRASISARELASQVGVSSAFISLLERGKSSASLTTLRGIATVLRQPLAALVDGDGNGRRRKQENGPTSTTHLDAATSVSGSVQVVRKNRRKKLELPGSFFKLELLSPDLQGMIEFIVIELEPGHPPTEPTAHIRNGEECVIVLEGIMGLTVGDTMVVLEAGDSARFDPAIPHRIENRGDCTLVQISAITPPSF